MPLPRGCLNSYEHGREAHVRQVYVDNETTGSQIDVRRFPTEKMLLQDALELYLKEITPTKRPSTQRAE
jgi:hypothetical protein